VEPISAGGRQGGLWTRGLPTPLRVTSSLPARRVPPSQLYTQHYIPGRDGEPLQGAATRTVQRSHLHHTFQGNQLRLWFSSIAYVLMNALRQNCLATTELASAQVGTIRTKLLKLGARVPSVFGAFRLLSALAVPSKQSLLLPIGNCKLLLHKS